MVKEFKGFYKLTNSGLGMHIARFIETLRDEKYTAEYTAFQLEGITQKAQELINRRRNLAEKEKEETPENEAATEETSETPEEGVA